MSHGAPLTNCSNCGTFLTGKHCHECGQKANVHRVTLHDLFHEVWHVLTHTDKGIFRLIIDLALRPVSVYEGYFNGQRKKYFSPVLFFLVTAGILAFLSTYVFDYEDKVTHMNNEYGRVMFHLTKYRALILLPFEALLLWAVFRRWFNLAEVTVFMLFCLGFIYTIRIALIPVYFPLIKHKSVIDEVLTVISYLILWLHASLVLARKQPALIVLLFVLINLFYIADGVLQRYLIFETDMFNSKVSGVGNLWQMIREIYSF